jgi:hypothetical protein
VCDVQIFHTNFHSSALISHASLFTELMNRKNNFGLYERASYTAYLNLAVGIGWDWDGNKWPRSQTARHGLMVKVMSAVPIALAS